MTKIKKDYDKLIAEKRDFIRNFRTALFKAKQSKKKFKELKKIARSKL
ncbi:unnamed protein product [marine sediment metagenome]|uniref:Uncharacterized protein n=1 Tax=marine sediment metagenome TaxID=412755 RepID=X1B6Z3_9ZZZZ